MKGETTMFELLKQEIKFSPLCLICIGVGWITFLIDRKSAELVPQAAYMLAFFMTAGIVAAVINRELRDSHGGGYGLLRTLPLSDKEIVLVKLLAILFDILLSWTLVGILFSAVPAQNEIRILNLSYITIWCLCTLICLSVYYLSIFRFGFGRSTLTISLFLIVFLLPLSLYLDQAMDFRSSGGFPQVISGLAELHWSVWLLLISATLVLSILLFHAATRLKESLE
jgi:hypothetical protein